jgi:hypothetical protein
MVVDQESLVGVETRRGLHGSEIEFQTEPGTHPASYTMVTLLFPRLRRPGRGINHSPHLTPWLKN